MELRFVSLLNETKIDGFIIKKNEVGIIATEDGENYIINFSNADYPLKINKKNVVLFFVVQRSVAVIFIF